MKACWCTNTRLPKCACCDSSESRFDAHRTLIYGKMADSIRDELFEKYGIGECKCNASNAPCHNCENGYWFECVDLERERIDEMKAAEIMAREHSPDKCEIWRLPFTNEAEEHYHKKRKEYEQN